jgi:glutamine synthetase
MLTAGMEGVREEIEPPVGAGNNIYHMTSVERDRAGIETLPGDLYEAHQALIADDLICRALGPHVVEALTNATNAEWDAYRTAVHPWELDRYLATY